MDSSNDTRLGDLLGRYQRSRALDPRAPLADLETEAGALYPELQELVACLDLMIDDSAELSSALAVTASRASGPERRPPAARRTNRGLVVVLFTGLVVLALGVWAVGSAWILPPTTLAIRAHSAATLLIDGQPLGDTVRPGHHVLRATRSGFTPLEVSIEVERGATFTHDLWLTPADPFEPRSLQAFAETHGFQFLEPSALLPRPAVVAGDSPDQEVPTPEVPAPEAPGLGVLGETDLDGEAARLEQARLPAAVRETDAGRYLCAERLYRLGWYRPSLRLSLALCKAHPDRKEPLRLALHALWGLSLVESPNYRTLYRRYRSED